MSYQKFLYTLFDVLAELNRHLVQTDLVFSLESKYRNEPKNLK